mmetsp:Transcript_12024/g.18567  ORF Transcript_12024/g.18567 Transcript_12024/m.18567 type:complete len:130 (-) Transcript_12024:1780-2169(-)
MAYHIAQKKENDQYKRMIDSIDEAIVVVQDGSFNFVNKIWTNLQDWLGYEDAPHEQLFDHKLFYVFKQQDSSEANASQGHGDQEEDTLLAMSVREILKLPASRLRNLIFTFTPEYAQAKTMDHMQKVLE